MISDSVVCAPNGNEVGDAARAMVATSWTEAGRRFRDLNTERRRAEASIARKFWRRFMAWSRKGGRSKSPAKVAASRENLRQGREVWRCICKRRREDKLKAAKLF